MRVWPTAVRAFRGASSGHGRAPIVKTSSAGSHIAARTFCGAVKRPAIPHESPGTGAERRESPRRLIADPGCGPNAGRMRSNGHWRLSWRVQWRIVRGDHDPLLHPVDGAVRVQSRTVGECSPHRHRRPALAVDRGQPEAARHLQMHGDAHGCIRVMHKRSRCRCIRMHMMHNGYALGCTRVMHNDVLIG